MHNASEKLDVMKYTTKEIEIGSNLEIGCL